MKIDDNGASPQGWQSTPATTPQVQDGSAAGQGIGPAARTLVDPNNDAFHFAFDDASIAAAGGGDEPPPLKRRRSGDGDATAAAAAPEAARQADGLRMGPLAHPEDAGVAAAAGTQ